MKVILPIGRRVRLPEIRALKLPVPRFGLANAFSAARISLPVHRPFRPIISLRSVAGKLSLPALKPTEWPEAVLRKLPDRRFGLLLAAALVSLAAGYISYQRYLEATQPVVAIQTVPAQIGSLVTTVTATGNAVDSQQAKLSFPVTGKLTEMDVKVGDSVKAGQVLAKVDPQPYQIKVNDAQSALNTAQIKLQQLKTGATPDQVAAAQAAYNAAVANLQNVEAGPTAAARQSAESAVQQAQATLNDAEAKLDQVKAGSTEADKVAAQSAVDQAKSTLNDAQVKLNQLKTNEYTAADWAAAQSAVDSDKAGLAAAQASLDQLQQPSSAEIADAQAAVDQAKAAMMSAQDRYQMAMNGNLQQSGASSNSAAQQDYEAAQSAYNSAVQKLQQLQSPAQSDLQSAESAVTQAQDKLNTDQAKLALMQQGPSPTDLADAQAAVDQAQANLNADQAKLNEVNAGPTQDDLTSAQAAVDQAKAGLASAEANLNQVNAGPTASDLKAAQSNVAAAKATLDADTNPQASDVALDQEQVNQAQNALNQAKLDLANTTLTAPFDGVVADVASNVGEQIGSAPVLTLVDPKSVRIDATVDESDVANIAVGQPATITFDALPNYQANGKVIAISPAGTSTQGVVSYLVSVAVTNPDRTLPDGMSATVSIETSRKDNVLLVPSRAIHILGRTQTVQVLQANDKPEVRTVQTGDSDGQMTEIVSGLKAGDQVVLPTTSTAQPRGNFQMGGGLGGSFGGTFRPAGR